LESGAARKAIRTYLRHELSTTLLLLRDCPGLLGISFRNRLSVFYIDHIWMSRASIRNGFNSTLLREARDPLVFPARESENQIEAFQFGDLPRQSPHRINLFELPNP
jgi:hypothetical protein